MGVEALYNYDTYLLFLEKSLDIWGQSATIFEPSTSRNKILGYEDQEFPVSAEEPSFKKEVVKVWVDFNPSRSVFYKFNWFPEDQDKLVSAFISVPERLKSLTYLRTSIIGQVSVWGDLIFRLVEIKDSGKYQTLKRFYFMRPISDSEVASLLVPGIPVKSDPSFSGEGALG